MLENGKEINLNLKMPPEQQDSAFSMRDLVLTIYSARKVFFAWCLIGILLGLIAAGGYYMSQRGTESELWESSVTLTLNYPGAEEGLFPNGADFSISSLYDVQLWENALKAVGRDDVTAADAIKEVNITRYKAVADENGVPIEDSMQEELLANTCFELSISSGGSVFENDNEAKMFLKALGEQYKNFINSNYFTEENIGMLYGQDLREWQEMSLEIIWDNFSFERNFTEISSRYTAWAEYLEELYNSEPSYKTATGASFNELAEDLRDIRDGELRYWLSKVNEELYIRNIDRFINEVQFQIESMRVNREYSAELANSYISILDSLGEKGFVNETIDILTAAKSEAEISADLQRRIGQLESYSTQLLENLETNETALRANSREAENALNAFIEELDKNRENLSIIIHDYYSDMNEKNSEKSVIFTTPTTTVQAGGNTGASMTRVLMLFLGCAFVGFVIGLCAAFIKKHLETVKVKGS
ncbi:MAG: hypothetical protein FWG70_06545 [Oscillospiraceae bacterium]|nr:hypothetical protein [Oscillospiraceae bacterium]